MYLFDTHFNKTQAGRMHILKNQMHSQMNKSVPLVWMGDKRQGNAITISAPTVNFPGILGMAAVGKRMLDGFPVWSSVS